MKHASTITVNADFFYVLLLISLMFVMYVAYLFLIEFFIWRDEVKQYREDQKVSRPTIERIRREAQRNQQDL